MTCASLAVELIYEILDYVISVPRDMFEDAGHISPFAHTKFSTARYLCVSRPWSAAGEPLLYKTVVLRRSPQAAALLRTLQARPRLGRYVRQLRIEGPYTNFITGIVRVAPGITDFCFTLRAWSDTPTTGLIQAIQLLNPLRVQLTLAPHEDLKNKSHLQLVAAVGSQIPRWTRLHTFKFAITPIYAVLLNPAPDYILYSGIFRALCASKSVQELYLPNHRRGPDNDRLIWAITTALEASPRLVIHLDGRRPCPPHVFAELCDELKPALLPRLINEPGCVGYTRLQPSPDNDDIDLPFNLLIPPVRHHLLKRILTFTLREAPLIPPGLGDTRCETFCFSRTVASLAPIVRLKLVSEEFKNLVEEIDLSDLRICCDDRANRVYRLLLDNPYHATVVGRIRIQHMRLIKQAELLSLLSRLAYARLPLNRDAITAVFATSGHRLRRLELFWGKEQPLHSFSLPSFSALQTLVVDVHASATVPEDFAQGHVTLQALTALEIHQAPRWFLRTIETFSLPSLVHLTCLCHSEFTVGIVGKFGCTVQHLHILEPNQAVWTATPRLLSLCVIRHMDSQPRWLRMYRDAQHTNLQTLFIVVKGMLEQVPHSAFQKRIWHELVGSILTRSRFPALSRIRVPVGREMWPTTERDEKTSAWVKLSDELYRRGVTLEGENGTTWRRRLSL